MPSAGHVDMPETECLGGRSTVLGQELEDSLDNMKSIMVLCLLLSQERT